MHVIGTSAAMLPAAMYIPIARNAGARVAYFNLEECEDEPGSLSFTQIHDGSHVSTCQRVPSSFGGVPP